MLMSSAPDETSIKKTRTTDILNFGNHHDGSFEFCYYCVDVGR